MKLFISTLFLFALASAAYGHSASWGIKTGWDVLLARDTIARIAERDNSWSVNIEFPQWPNKNNHLIKAIYVFDNFRNQSGAYPSIRMGGVGIRSCTVNLRGNNNQGINSTVEIWGSR